MDFMKLLFGEEYSLLEQMEYTIDVVEYEIDVSAYKEWLTEYMFGNSHLKGEEPGLLEEIEFMLKNGGDLGTYGEWLTEYMFGNNSLEGYYKLLRNIYVPYKGRTSEIDVLLVHKRGIFVIESKNYSGWIFGNEQQKYWTQCFPNYEKYKFYNPIMQNSTHINALAHYLSIGKEYMKSFIAFSERCELKKIPNNNKKYIILKRDRLFRNIKAEIESRQDIFTEKQVDGIIAKLQPLTEVSKLEKERHIEQIKNIF